MTMDQLREWHKEAMDLLCPECRNKVECKLQEIGVEVMFELDESEYGFCEDCLYSITEWILKVQPDCVV